MGGKIGLWQTYRMQKLQEILENVGRLAKCGVAGWTVEPWPSLWRKSHGTLRNPPEPARNPLKNGPEPARNPLQTTTKVGRVGGLEKHRAAIILSSIDGLQCNLISYHDAWANLTTLRFCYSIGGLTWTINRRDSLEQRRAAIVLSSIDDLQCNQHR